MPTPSDAVSEPLIPRRDLCTITFERTTAAAGRRARVRPIAGKATVSTYRRARCARSATPKDPAQDAPSTGKRAMDKTNLLDMIAVLEEEQRFNEAAALLCSNAAQRRQYATKVRQGAAAIKAIR